MYGVKRTSTILNTVIKGNVLFRPISLTNSVLLVSKPLKLSHNLLNRLNQSSYSTSTTLSETLTQAGVKNTTVVKKSNEEIIADYLKSHSGKKDMIPLMEAYRDLVQTGKQPSSDTYAGIITTLCNQAEQTRKALRSLRQKSQTSEAALTAKGPKPDELVKDALEVFRDAAQANLTQSFEVSVFNTLLKSIVPTGNTEAGLIVYEYFEQSGIKPDNQTFIQLIRLFARSQDRRAIRECLEEYRSLNFPVESRPQVYNTAISAYLNSGDLKAAKLILTKTFSSDGLKPTVISHNIILSYLAHTKINEAERFLTEFEPNSTSHAYLMAAYCRLKDLEKATQACDRLLDCPAPDLYRLPDYLQLCLQQDPDRLLPVLERAKGYQINVDMAKKIAEAYHDRPVDGLKTFNALTTPQPPNVFLHTLPLLSQSTDLLVSLQTLHALRLSGYHPSTELAKTVLDLYRQAQASPAWPDLLSKLQYREFYGLFDVVSNTSLSPQDYCEAVLGLREQMKVHGVNPSNNLYLRVLVRLRQYNLPDMIDRWNATFDGVEPGRAQASAPAVAVEAAYEGHLDQAYASIQTVFDHKKIPSMDSLREILRLSIQAGRQDLVDRLTSSILAVTQHKTPLIQSFFSSLIAYQARFGNLERLKTAYQTLASLKTKPDTSAYGHLVEKDLIDPLEAYRLTRHLVPNSFLQNVILSKLVKTGRPQAALEIVDQLKSLNTITYATAIRASLDLDDEARALRYFELAKGGQPRVGLYQSWIQYYIAKGQPEQALHYFNLMKDVLSPPPHTYSLLIQAYGLKQDGLAKAEQVLDQVDPTTGNYAALIRAYGRHGLLDQAHRVFDSIKVQKDAFVVEALVKVYLDHQLKDRAQSVFEANAVYFSNISFSDYIAKN